MCDPQGGVTLTEFIDPATTITNLVPQEYYIYNTVDKDVIARLEMLQESGMKAIAAPHDRFVIHDDLVGCFERG